MRFIPLLLLMTGCTYVGVEGTSHQITVSPATESNLLSNKVEVESEVKDVGTSNPEETD